MEFYEMKDSYFAIIAAEDEKQCLKLYNNLVCEVEDEKEFFEEMKTMEKYKAFKMVANSHTEEGEDLAQKEHFNILKILKQTAKYC